MTTATMGSIPLPALAPPSPPEIVNPHGLFKDYCTIPKWLLTRKEISQGAKLCYARLSNFAGKDGLCYPRLSTLASELGVSRRQAKRYVDELVAAGLIRSIRRGLCRSNLYEFLRHPWMEGHVREITDPETPDKSAGGSVTSGTDISVPSGADTCGNSFYKKNSDKEKKARQQEKADDAAVVSSSFSSDNEDSRMSDLLKLVKVPITDRIRSVIAKGCQAHGHEVVSRNIRYANEKCREPSKYDIFLHLSIFGDRNREGDWGKAWWEDLQARKAAERASEEARRKRKAEEARALEEERRRAERDWRLSEEARAEYLEMPESEQLALKKEYMDDLPNLFKVGVWKNTPAEMAENTAFLFFLMRRFGKKADSNTKERETRESIPFPLRPFV